jgi:hypothetical protein
MRLHALITLALPLAACPTGPGGLDLSGLPDGTYGETYDGQVAVAEYRGPVAFTLNGGELPPGLVMNEAGAVTGTPTFGGTFEFDVLASGLRGVEDFVGTIVVRVSAKDVLGAFLGHVHDQPTQLNEMPDPLNADMWLRVAGGGIADMSEYTVQPGVFTSGADGVVDYGGGDDVQIGAYPLDEVTIEMGVWNVVEGDGRGHEPEGEPVLFDGVGTFTAQADTGKAPVTITHPDWPDPDNTRILVEPGDWCPKGHQRGNYWDDPFAACE